MTAVLVTRPAHDARDWVQRLRAHGIAAEALPLMAIEPEPPNDALHQARHALADWQALMFVSGNAVDGFMAGIDAGWARRVADSAVRAWSPGPGTTAALRRHGWPLDRIDEPAADAPQFESETLWERVARQLRPGSRVLIVRGGDAQGRLAGRDWMRQQLLQAGVQVEQIVAYRRAPAVLDAARQARARAAASDGSLWLFSSSEVLAHLQHGLPDVDWSAAQALATHARIAQAARALGFARVDETRPAFEDVLASIKSRP